MAKITSRSVQRKSKPRTFKCPICERAKQLRFGLHWCHCLPKTPTAMTDMQMQAGIERCVMTALAGMIGETAYTSGRKA